MWYQPSRSTAAVASGAFQYPAMTVSPRTTISPTSSSAVTLPSERRTSTSSSGSGRPTDARRLRSAGSPESRYRMPATPVASVIPNVEPSTSPKTAPSRCSSAGRIGAPPVQIARTLHRSRQARSGSRGSNVIIAGASCSWVIRRCSMMRTTSDATKSAITTWAPAKAGDSPADWPRQTYGGMQLSTTSSPRNRLAMPYP